MLRRRTFDARARARPATFEARGLEVLEHGGGRGGGEEREGGDAVDVVGGGGGDGAGGARGGLGGAFLRLFFFLGQGGARALGGGVRAGCWGLGGEAGIFVVGGRRGVGAGARGGSLWSGIGSRGGFRDGFDQAGYLPESFRPLLFCCAAGVAVLSLAWGVRLVSMTAARMRRGGGGKLTFKEKSPVVMSTRELMRADARLLCSGAGQDCRARATLMVCQHVSIVVIFAAR